MAEPWASFGTLDELGLPAPLAAMVARAEAKELRAEQRAEAERLAEAEDRAEARLHIWMVQRAQQLAMEGKSFNLNDPASLVMSPEEQAQRVFAAEDRAAARSEFRAKVDAGLLHVLDVRPDEMRQPGPDPEPEPDPAAAARSREAGYVKLRLRRFFNDLADASKYSGKART
jgi:hypothetical protein